MITEVTLVIRHDALQRYSDKITNDEAWQKGMDDDERRICIAFAMNILIFAQQSGWNMDRACGRVMDALRACGGKRQEVESESS